MYVREYLLEKSPLLDLFYITVLLPPPINHIPLKGTVSNLVVHHNVNTKQTHPLTRVNCANRVLSLSKPFQLRLFFCQSVCLFVSAVGFVFVERFVCLDHLLVFPF